MTSEANQPPIHMHTAHTASLGCITQSEGNASLSSIHFIAYLGNMICLLYDNNDRFVKVSLKCNCLCNASAKLLFGQIKHFYCKGWAC